MSAVFLPKSGVFSSGSNLWILPSLKHSSWVALVDWYLNFQISRSLKHSSVKVEGGTLAIAEEFGIEYSQFYFSASTPLMISSLNLLPNQQTLIIPKFESTENWFNSAKKVWQNLNKPSLRIFLPREIQRDHAVNELSQSFWRGHQITLVCDGNISQ